MDISKNPPYMFSSKKIDYFFNWHWWSAPMLFLPISAMLFAYAFTNLSLQEMALSLILGGVLWTLYEYLMHRFLFHFIGHTPLLKHLHYIAHGMHHAHATDPMRVIFPPFLSLILGAIMGGVFLLFLPLSWAMGIFAGFIIGYTWYEFMHYADHHIKWKYSWFKRLKRHHLLHHHSAACQSKNFGVTTSIWDKVFNTFMA